MAKPVVLEPEVPNINLIGPGTVIKGDIKTNGDFRIDGTIVGNVICKGKIVVGKSGSIEGEINCQNAEISGNIKGKLMISEQLSLKSSAKIQGEISTQKIAIEPGAFFTGNCNMNSHYKESNPSNLESRAQESIG